MYFNFYPLSHASGLLFPPCASLYPHTQLLQNVQNMMYLTSPRAKQNITMLATGGQFLLAEPVHQEQTTYKMNYLSFILKH